jgi:hypothetical protein
MQVTIYDLAYQGKVREDKVVKIADSNINRTMNIAKLKSAQSLGDWFFCKNADADFVSQKHIVQVKASSEDIHKVRLASAPKRTSSLVSLLARVFSLKSIAEAEPIR